MLTKRENKENGRPYPLQTVAAASGAQGEGVLGFGELMWRDAGSPFGRERRKELHVARRWEEVGVRGL